MASPTKYQREYSFTDYQSNNPSQPLPGLQVDNELENVEQSLDEAIDAINDVRRADGALKNGIVTLDSLDETVAAGVGDGALASATAAAASADAAATARNAAQSARDDAIVMKNGADTARDYAAAWASAAEDVEVDDGVNDPGNSAYHWAQVALGAAAGAIPDGGVTTVKIADEAVSEAKLASAVVATISGKLQKDQNGSDIPDKAAFRANLVTGHALQALAEPNMLVNAHLQVSQEHGSDALTTSDTYGADQQAVVFNAGAISHGRKVASFTGVDCPFPYMYEINVTTADASLAADEFAAWTSRIEADRFGGRLQWGTSYGVPLLHAYLIEANFTGTVGSSVVNNVVDRSYVTEISVVADTPQIVVLETPADTSGTWNKLAGLAGGELRIALAAGTTYQATADTWSAGNYLGTATATNGLGALNRLRILPLGMWPKRSGLTKAMLESLTLQDFAWLMRPYGQELDDCLRYLQRFTSEDNAFTSFGTGVFTTATEGYSRVPFLKKMRVAPTFSSSAASTIMGAGSISLRTATKYMATVLLGGGSLSGTVGEVLDMQTNNTFAAFLQFSARM